MMLTRRFPARTVRFKRLVGCITWYSWNTTTLHGEPLVMMAIETRTHSIITHVVIDLVDLLIHFDNGGGLET